MKENCSEVTLYDFIRCMFHQDYTVLSDEKKLHTDKELIQLSERWGIIYEEFCQICENPQYSNLLDSLNEIIRLQEIIYRSGAAMAVISLYHDFFMIKELIKQDYPENDVNYLKSIGFNVNFDKNDIESYEKDFKNVEGKLKGFELQLQMEQKKVQDKQKNTENKGQTEAEFMEGVAVVGKSQGYNISIKQTSLLEWSGMVKLHNKMASKSNQNGK